MCLFVCERSKIVETRVKVREWGIHEFDRDFPVTNYVMPSRMKHGLHRLQVCLYELEMFGGLQELWCDVMWIVCLTNRWNEVLHSKPLVGCYLCVGFLEGWCVAVVNLGMDIMVLGSYCTNWQKWSFWGIASFWDRGGGIPCNVEVIHHQNMSKCVVGSLFQICVGCCCLFSLLLDGHLSWVYIPVKRIQLVLCDADFVRSRTYCVFLAHLTWNMSLTATFWYKGFSVAVLSGVNIMRCLFLARNLRLRFIWRVW